MLSGSPLGYSAGKRESNALTEGVMRFASES